MKWVKKLLTIGKSTSTDRQTAPSPVDVAALAKEVLSQDSASLSVAASSKNAMNIDLEAHKHDLDAMKAAAIEESARYWQSVSGLEQSEIPPAVKPDAFLRVAILSRKARNFDQEIAFCEKWVQIEQDYRHRAATCKATTDRYVKDYTIGPIPENIRKRLARAKKRLDKR
ncbi:hypothetical protein [Halotalea alkalilenta]|uniref:hypothetical protein n=1 Tax=Halotalea alkalilenta TaxID=376489 RepID=UPI000480DC0B|nr:hypothetical protein [Halotalea alkalilenta]